MQLLKALSRSGTRRLLLDRLLSAQEGPAATIQDGMGPSEDA